MGVGGVFGLGWDLLTLLMFCEEARRAEDSMLE